MHTPKFYQANGHFLCVYNEKIEDTPLCTMFYVKGVHFVMHWLPSYGPSQPYQISWSYFLSLHMLSCHFLCVVVKN